MKSYRRFKTKYKLLHILIVAIAIVTLWRGAWGLLDLLMPDFTVISYLGSMVVAFVILYVDDFHLKELE